MDKEMDTSSDDWVDPEEVEQNIRTNYCDVENGIFWGEYTEEEEQYVNKLKEQLANKSSDDLSDGSDDNQCIAELMDNEESIEPLNFSDFMSPVVSSIGSPLSPKRLTVTPSLSSKEDFSHTTNSFNVTETQISSTTRKSTRKSTRSSTNNSMITESSSNLTVAEDMQIQDQKETTIAETLSSFVSPVAESSHSKKSFNVTETQTSSTTRKSTRKSTRSSTNNSMITESSSNLTVAEDMQIQDRKETTIAETVSSFVSPVAESSHSKKSLNVTKTPTSATDRKYKPLTPYLSQNSFGLSSGKRLSQKSVSFKLDDLYEEDEEVVPQFSSLLAEKSMHSISLPLSPIFEANDSKKSSDESSLDLVSNYSMDEMNSTFTVGDKTTGADITDDNQSKYSVYKAIDTELIADSEHKTVDSSIGFKEPQLEKQEPKTLMDMSTEDSDKPISISEILKIRSTPAKKRSIVSRIPILLSTVKTKPLTPNYYQRPGEPKHLIPKMRKLEATPLPDKDIDRKAEQSGTTFTSDLRKDMAAQSLISSFINAPLTPKGPEIVLDSLMDQPIEEIKGQNETTSSSIQSVMETLSHNKTIEPLTPVMTKFESTSLVDQTINCNTGQNETTFTSDDRKDISVHSLNSESIIEEKEQLTPKRPQIWLNSLMDQTIEDYINQNETIETKDMITTQSQNQTAEQLAPELAKIESTSPLDLKIEENLTESEISVTFVESKDNSTHSLINSSINNETEPLTPKVSEIVLNSLMDQSIGQIEAQNETTFSFIQQMMETQSQSRTTEPLTPENAKFESTSLLDQTVEVNAKDLLSPFFSNMNPRAQSRAQVSTSRDDVAITRSLVALNATPATNTQKSTGSSINLRPILRFTPYQANRRQTRQSAANRNSSMNESTLDFILNEIKCNTEDTEQFLTTD